MQSFGAPRPTTNPYIVMLRDSLVASPEVEHVPFSWRTALTGSYDVFHVHWPDTLLDARSPARRMAKRLAFAGLLVRLRLRGTPVVRTVHNLTEPRGGAIDRRLVAALNRRIRMRIRINAATPEVAGIPSVLAPHGHYRNWYAPMPRRERTTDHLGYVGLIKPYKGVENLVAAFEEAVAAQPGVSLRVQGRPADDQVASWLRAAADRIPGLSLTLRYLDEEEFVAAVTESALVVLPYRELHNSGAALAALSLDRPVLVPDNDTTRALADEVGADWVLTFTGELTAATLRTALARVAEPPIEGPDLSARDWSETAARHVDAYRKALGHA
ncbi:MAG: glycosyl transferase [Microbacterium sp.]|nr:MAG: glycosyl transferase [Microbacterium sp.]